MVVATKPWYDLSKVLGAGTGTCGPAKPPALAIEQDSNISRMLLIKLWEVGTK